MWLDHTTKISNKRLLLSRTSSSSQCISAFFSNFAGIIYTGRPNSWRKHGEGRFRTFELIGPEEVVQTGISFGSQGHSRSLRMVLFDSRQNFCGACAYLASFCRYDEKKRNCRKQTLVAMETFHENSKIKVQIDHPRPRRNGTVKTA